MVNGMLVLVYCAAHPRLCSASGHKVKAQPCIPGNNQGSWLPRLPLPIKTRLRRPAPGKGKASGFWCQPDLGLNALFILNCIPLGKWLHPDCRFPHLWSKDNNGPYLKRLERLQGHLACMQFMVSSTIVVQDKNGPGMWFTVQIVNSPAWAEPAFPLPGSL